MKTSFHSIALVIAAGLLPPAWAQFDQTYYRLDGGNSGSLLNIGQMPPCGSVNPTPPPCSPCLNLPVYGSLNLHKNGTAPNNNVAVANIHSYLTGVSGGTYNSVQTVFTPFFADSVMATQGQNISLFGYGRGLGKGNNNTLNSIMDCWGGSALNGVGSVPSCGFGESDFTTGPSTFQGVAPKPPPNTVTFQYSPVAHEEALGARLLLNKNTKIAGDGVAAYVSKIDPNNIRTLEFAGIVLPQQPGNGNYYIKLSSTDDLYQGPCNRDDVTISHPNLGSDNLCIGHWYPVNITDATHADTSWKRHTEDTAAL